MAPITLTLKMRFDQAKKEKNPRRRRPPPIEIKNPVPKPDARHSRHPPSPRSHSECTKVQAKAVFPYHIDEENEIIYKMANDGTWTQGVPSGEQEEHSGRLVRWAEVPQTLEFNYDWVLTKIAAEARNSDLRRVVNRVMLVRQAHDVSEFPTRIMPVPEYDVPEEPVPSYGADAILNSDGSYATWVNWDYLLRDIKDASKLMMARRRWKMQGTKKVAAWCVWGRNQTIENRTEFVEDIRKGYVIEKSFGGQDGSQTRLGYRRQEECGWGNVTGPWDPETRTDHDRAVTT